MKKKLSASLNRLKKSTDAAANAEQVDSDLRTKLKASEENCRGLSTGLQVEKTGFADHIATVRETTAVDDTVKSKLHDVLSNFRTEFKSYRRKSKKK